MHTASIKTLQGMSLQVGSIGVITAGFGLHRVLEKYEIERRVFTAGISDHPHILHLLLAPHHFAA